LPFWSTEESKESANLGVTVSHKSAGDLAYAFALLMNSISVVLAGVRSPPGYRQCLEACYERTDGTVVQLFCHHLAVTRLISSVNSAAIQTDLKRTTELLKSLYEKIDSGLSYGQNKSLTEILLDCTGFVDNMTPVHVATASAEARLLLVENANAKASVASGQRSGKASVNQSQATIDAKPGAVTGKRKRGGRHGTKPAVQSTEREPGVYEPGCVGPQGYIRRANGNKDNPRDCSGPCVGPCCFKHPNSTEGGRG
jgi:hypothetical protein